MKESVLDSFEDLTGWTPISPGQVQLRLSRETGAMRMDFDFGGGGGFAVARKEFVRRLPDDCAFCFRIRGEAPPNIFEFKLVDRGGTNVWRYREESMTFTGESRELRLPLGKIPFAWGPAGGGPIRNLGAIEFVIAAGSGGKGTVWIEDLRFLDGSRGAAMMASASSEMIGHEAMQVLLKGICPGWRPKSSDRSPWLQLDFGAEKEYGGLIIEWARRSGPRSFDVKGSTNGKRWSTLTSVRDSHGDRSFVRLPGGSSRFLRIAFRRRRMKRPPTIRRLSIQPQHFGTTEMEFLHCIAALQPRGRFPKYLYRRQSYWTCVGLPDGDTRALINQEGLVEPNEASFSLEPFLFDRGRLLTWADASISQDLLGRSIPIPSSIWRLPGMTLRITAAAEGDPGETALLVRYRLDNTGRQRRRIRLFIAMRPLQVTPPWQSWKHFGGISPIGNIRWRLGAAWVNKSIPVVPLSSPSGFGATAFSQADITDYLATGKLPAASRVTDPMKLASAALRFDLFIPPHGRSEVLVAVPLSRHLPAKLTAPRDIKARYRGQDAFSRAVRTWDSALAAVRWRFPRAMAAMGDTCRTAAAQILINRDGPAIQPGPRRYTRSWIRDGAIMSAALLRFGRAPDVRNFIEWYAAHQRADGFVPCCVDRSGPDWLIEHDSHGQLIYAIMEYFRFTGDRAFLQSMWPVVRKASGIMASLRSQRLGPEFDRSENIALRGLLPESASHEGYLAHPVHSYWDDFWAIRGLKDAATAAGVLGHESDAKTIGALRDSLMASVKQSIDATIASRGIDYVPASVELADFDPTSTAIALSLLHGSSELPQTQLARTFETFVADFRKKRSGKMPWSNYTAYEIRIIGALVRLGKRAEALELLKFFLSDRRPLPWNQWPEISWRDRNAPGHVGDIPHTWIGAEYILAFFSLFSFESETDDSLVIGAGIDPSWPASAGGFKLSGLGTWYGKLDLEMSADRAGHLTARIGGDIRLPSGGIIFHPPTTRPARRTIVNGKTAEISREGTAVSIREFPAEIFVEPSRG